MTCNACGARDFTEVLDMGPMPIAHRFIPVGFTGEEFTHPLTIHICNACALIQVLNPIPPETLYKNFNYCFSTWKPNPQISDEISIIKDNVKLGAKSLVVEIGSNDGTFLKCLKDAGINHVVGVEPNTVACEIATKAGLDVTESFFNDATADKIQRDRGPVTLVVSRQVVEHITDLRSLLKNINHFIVPDGWILFEVPDFEVPMQNGDCTALWEEHVNYFTGPVLTRLLARHGFETKIIKRYDFSGGAVMVLAQKSGSVVETGADSDIRSVRDLAANFRAKVGLTRTAVHSIIDETRKQGRPVVIYGAGNRANAATHGLGLKGKIDAFFDDQKEKQGMLMPGSRIAIQSGDALSKNLGTCFLSLNSENDAKVTSKHAEYEVRGGKFFGLNSPGKFFLRTLGGKL